MKKQLTLITALVFCCTAVFATWSIIIIDPKTKEIGIVGASCTFNCYGIGKIVAGRGAVIVQAMSNNAAREKGVQLILSDMPPQQIIQAMQDPAFDPARQQYAVVTIKHINTPATFTGDSTKKYKGALTANGVSVQGNTLTNDNELQVILNIVLKGQQEKLAVAEILMNALEAGSASGGDKRCGEQKASSAFMTVAKPGDKNPYLDLRIFGQGKGGQNAVVLLRKKFEKWKRKHTPHQTT